MFSVHHPANKDVSANCYNVHGDQNPALDDRLRLTPEIFVHVPFFSNKKCRQENLNQRSLMFFPLSQYWRVAVVRIS